MLNGNSNEEVNLSDIDFPIRNLIIYLNSIEGVITTGCCSGHPQDGKARAYISFEDTKHPNFLKLLDLFDDIGFKIVPPNYDINLWFVDIILEKGSGDVTEEDIIKFWKEICCILQTT